MVIWFWDTFRSQTISGKGYYEALQDKIEELRERYKDDTQAQNLLNSEQSQVDIYRRNMRYYGSAFFVMQKK